LREAIRAGDLDNASFTVGLELECYAVDDRGRLVPIPGTVFEDAPVEKELGLHNVEVNTEPSVLDGAGLREQATSIEHLLDEARRAAGDAGIELVLDGMWTIPPTGGTVEYLSAVDRIDGVTVAANMRESPRYRALDNDVLERTGGSVGLDVPGVDRSFPTILFESLTTSIQPHLQIPTAEAFPRHYNAAIRTLGPVLALSTNSPFLPVDLYADCDAYRLVETTDHELRIPVFEQSVNAGEDPGKVRFPGDIDRPEDVVDRIVDDLTVAPFLAEWIEDDGADEAAYSDTFPELDHKRGTYWRWLRAVIGGDPVGPGNTRRSLRIEYRPLPTQPTVADVVGLQWLVSGLIRGIVAEDHPLVELPWKEAKRCFYGVVADGLDADLAWIGADGTRTTDPTDVFPELFDLARQGLHAAGVPSTAVNDRLRPIEARWERRLTPSQWKLDRVREGLDDGLELAGAMDRMQATYRDRSRSGVPFYKWQQVN
ncbi:MAG: hypothetical protein R3324_03765, partial [Halobacteriales archaeon]|nr:hypothetical protein [Halobacteriales archaeon]